MKNKRVPYAFTRGKPIVNSVSEITLKKPIFKIVHVDLRTKYTELSETCDSDDNCKYPKLTIKTNSESIKSSKHKKDWTEITLKKYPGYSIIADRSYRYGYTLILLKETV